MGFGGDSKGGVFRTEGRCTLKWGDFVPKNSKSACSKRGLKNQLPSLVDLFDRCFSHTPGEGLQLWFFSLIEFFWAVRTLSKLAMSGVIFQKKSFAGENPTLVVF
jgi:hypothetical protein